MAKKTAKFALDDYGFDSSLDMQDFDFEKPQTKFDRNPAVKAAKAVGKGAATAIMSPSFIRKLITDSLPTGYGSAVSIAGESASTIKGLYNDTVKEIKPVINDLKRTTKRILPNVETSLPKNVAARIKKWSDSAESRYKGMSDEQQRDASLQMQLGEIFQFQTEAALRNTNETRARSMIQEGIDHLRHRDTVTQLDAMRISLQQIANYKQKIDSGFQRKSLEIQFRHYFVAQDSLLEQKKQNVIMTERLDGILKNTGLPDFVKLNKAESLRQIIRNRFMESVNDGVFSKRNDFIKRLGSKLGSKLKEGVSGFKDMASAGMSMAETGSMALDMGKDMGMSGTDMAGGKFGEFIGDYGGRKIANKSKRWLNEKAKKYIPKGTADRFSKLNNQLDYGLNNSTQIASDWASRESNAGPHRKGVAGKVAGMFDSGGILGGLGDLLKETIKETASVDKTLDTDKAGSMRDPEVFNRGASKAITEVIPGFLARIFRELQIIRTGDEKIALTGYDFTTNKFADKGTIAKNLLNTITGSGNLALRDEGFQKEITALGKKKKLTKIEEKRLEYLRSAIGKTNSMFTKEQIDKLIAEVDTGNSLDAKQREVLSKQMLSDNLKNKSSDFKRLSNKDTYQGESAPHAEAFARMFAEYSRDDTSFAKQSGFSKKFNAIGENSRDGRSEVQTHYNLGQNDILEELGLTESRGYGDNVINIDNLRGYTAGIKEAPADGKTSSNKSRYGKRRKPRHLYLGGAIHETDPKLKGKKDTVEAMLDDGEFVLKSGAVKKIGEGKLHELNRLGDNVQHMAEGGRVNKGGNSGLSTLVTIQDTLLRIEKKVNDGVPVVSGDASNDGKGHWWNKSIKQTVKNLGGGAFNLAGKGLGAIKGMTDNLFNVGKKIAGVGLDVGKWAGGIALDKVKDRIQGLREIYVKGETVPRLTLWKIKAGHYRDKATGKVIKTFKDISGDVIDIMNPDVIVLAADDIKDAYVKDRLGKKLIMALGSTIKKVSQGVSKAANMILSALPPLARGAFWLGKKAYGLLKLPADVYTKNNPQTPTLTKVTMKAGGYKSRITGKVINHPGDIDGPVLDDENQEVLSAKDLAMGLYDIHGKPLRTGLGKITGFIKDQIKGAARTANKAFNFVKDKAFALGRGVKNFALGGVRGLLDGTGGSGMGGVAGESILTRLTEIRDVLKDRLPRSRTIRKGSYEDLMSKKKQDATDKLVAAKDKLTGGKSLGGMFAGGIASLFGKKKKSEDDDDEGGVGSMAQDYAEMKLVDKAGAWGKKGWGALKRGGKFLGGKGKALWKLGGAALGLGGAGMAANAATGAPMASTVATAGNVGTTAANAASVGSKGFGIGKAFGSMAGKFAGSGIGKFASKAFLPATAALSAYGGISDLAAGKKVSSLGDVVPEGWGKINPLDWAMRGGMYVGDKYNAGVNKVTSMVTGNKDDTFGTALFDGIDKLTRAISGAPDPAAPITLDDINKARKEAGKPPLPAKPNLGTPGSPSAIQKVAAQVIDNNTSATGLEPNGKETTVTASFVPVGLNKLSEGRIDALSAIRYKAYGLKEMDADKVKAIINLENLVNKDMTFSGRKTVASWSGSVNKITLAAGPLFGISGVNNTNGYRWSSWFSVRFLPIYLNYATSIADASGKKDGTTGLVDLKPPQLVEVAKAIITTPKVWEVDASPWPDYELNMDKDSTNKNLQSLTDDVKKNVVSEEAATVDIGLAQQTATKSANAVTPPPTSKSWTDSLSSGWNKATGYVKEKAAEVVTGLKNAAGAVASGVSTAGKFIGEAFSGGQAVTHPGQGTGGDINSLPLPKGDGSWAALKELITAAAKMAGVDEKLMATMAAIESGFRSTVKAGTSSATGLYQFISGTWSTMLRKYGAKYGIAPGTPATDPRANALMGAEFIKENANALKGVKKGELTDTDLYIAHFMGAGGAKKFLSADPSAIAADLMPAAARANEAIFYDKSKRPLTVAEVYNVINDRVRSKGKQFGLNSGGGGIMLASATGVGGGRGAVNPSPVDSAQPTPSTGAGAGRGSVNSLGVPVSEQTPGVSNPTPNVDNGTTTGKTTSAQPATNSNDVGGVVAAGAGFMAPRSQDLLAQRQFQKDTSADAFSGVGKTLESSLTVQQGQLDVLQKILTLMSSNKGSSSATADGNQQPTIRGGSNVPSEMPKAPVSMNKSMMM